MKKGLLVLAMIFFAFNSYGQQSKADSIAIIDSIAATEASSRLVTYIIQIENGLKYKRDGKYKEALDSFDLAISIDSNYPEVYYHIGELYFDMENYIKSVENLSKAIERGRKDLDVFYLRGMAKFYLGDYRGSDLDYLKAFEVVDKKTAIKSISGLFFNMGLNKSELKDYKGAIGDYTKALSFDENNFEALTNRGFYRIKIGDVNGGCLDLSKAGEFGNEKAYRMINEYCN
jgi:tetratricopeptide (TPR) repeat protein